MQRAIDVSGFLDSVESVYENAKEEKAYKDRSDFLIAIKPNIMTASTHEEPSPVYTDPELVEHLIQHSLISRLRIVSDEVAFTWHGPDAEDIEATQVEVEDHPLFVCKECGAEFVVMSDGSTRTYLEGELEDPKGPKPITPEQFQEIYRICDRAGMAAAMKREPHSPVDEDGFGWEYHEDENIWVVESPNRETLPFNTVESAAEFIIDERLWLKEQAEEKTV